MANYAASVLAEAKLILAQRYASPEKRLKTAGVLSAFLKNSDLAIPNLGEMRVSELRAEKGYFFNRSKRSATATRTHNHTGSIGDSTEVAFSWATYVDNFQTSLKRHENNLMSDAALLANEIDNAIKNLHEDIDAAALAHLATNKSGVNVATKNGTFSALNDAWEIATADISRFIQYSKSMLRQNYYGGQADMILDSLLYAEAEYLAAQGGGNATNFGYQFAGVGLMESVQLDDANYALGAGYIIPTGTIGAVDWTPPKNRQGVGSYDTVLGGYGTMIDPITGLTLAVHGYSDRADTSATGGSTQDNVTNWEISIDMSFNNSPLTIATESTIFEIGKVA